MLGDVLLISEGHRKAAAAILEYLLDLGCIPQYTVHKRLSTPLQDSITEPATDYDSIEYQDADYYYSQPGEEPAITRHLCERRNQGRHYGDQTCITKNNEDRDNAPPGPVPDYAFSLGCCKAGTCKRSG